MRARAGQCAAWPALRAARRPPPAAGTQRSESAPRLCEPAEVKCDFQVQVPAKCKSRLATRHTRSYVCLALYIAALIIINTHTDTMLISTQRMANDIAY